MTVGGLIHNLTAFADFYESASAEIEREEGATKPWYIGYRDANADVMQRAIQATAAIDRVRAYVLSNYGADLTIGTARRLLGDLIRRCTLTVKAAEELLLEKAMDRLAGDPGKAGSIQDDRTGGAALEPKRSKMADNPLPPTPGGLTHFDLPTIFRCAVELAEAAARLTEAEWADLPADCEGPASPIFERQMEASRRLRRIEEETERLKRSLGATGPLQNVDIERNGDPKWESYDQRFNNTMHDRFVRLALTKLATAAIDLSGFATWREWQWHMREVGMRLLAWGLAQLWEGMSGDERSRVRHYLPRTHKAISWPTDAANEPTPFDGPEEIPLLEQYRITSNYISCYRNYLDDVQKAGNMRVEQGQERFLRQAGLTLFVETAQRAAQAVQAMAKREFDTSEEWVSLYSQAFWSLACLRRAGEIQPREAWPQPAQEQRKLLADAAGVLLTFVGATPDARAGLNPEEGNKAFEQFEAATRELRSAIKAASIEPQQLKNPVANVPLDQSTMAAGKAMLAHVDSLAASNTAIRQMVIDLGERHAGGATSGIPHREPAPGVNHPAARRREARNAARAGQSSLRP
jgi:hypothetical protein